MNLAKLLKIVPILNSANIGAGVDGNSLNMAKAHRAVFVILFGALGADSATLKFFSGAGDGTKTSALNYKYAIGSANVGSALCDVLGAELEVATLTLTNTLHGSKMLVVEIDTNQMDMNNNENWLTMELSSGATSGTCQVIAVIEPRYSDSTTVLA